MTDLNLRGAVFSFLRVLAVAEASAYLALTTGGDPITGRALGLAAASALALTVVNYLRPGEPRFGPEPKVGDAGLVLIEWLVLATLVLVVLLILGVV